MQLPVSILPGSIRPGYGSHAVDEMRVKSVKLLHHITQQLADLRVFQRVVSAF
jgi:hypothetical protein